MGHERRVQFPGAICHVTSRGNDGMPIFREQRDRERHLALLAAVCAKYGWKCHVWCQMTNHFHLLIETPEPNLGAGMKKLNGDYALWFNRRHGRAGHLFKRPYHAVLVVEESHLLEVCRYVVLNPARAGLCAVPADWRWSSYRAAAGIAGRPPFLCLELLELVGGPAGYRRFVAAGSPAGSLDGVLLAA